MRRVIAAAIVLCVSCGPTNSAVTLGGTTLKPQSSAMTDIVFGPLSATIVLVTDQPDLCGTATKAGPCGTQQTWSTGTVLEIVASGTTPGTYPISPPDAGSTGFQVKSALAYLASTGGTTLGFADTAVSGTITLDAVSVNNSASGHYDAVMASGPEIKGSFFGQYCAALLQGFSGSGVSCSSQLTATSCDNRCTCQNKTVDAQCAQDAGQPWACTCLSAAGVTTTCTMPASASDACGQSTSCCPFSF